MPDVYNDGTLPYGSRVLVIDGVNYVAPSFDYNEPLGGTIERKTHLNIPSGQVLFAGFRQGTATLQLETTATAIPAQFTTFATPIRGVSTTFIITDVGTPEGNEIEKLVSITFRKLINS